MGNALKRALELIERTIEELRGGRAQQTIDRWEAVESAHVAARPALPDRLVELITRAGWEVDLYSLAGARRDLVRLRERAGNRRCRFDVVLHHVNRLIERRRPAARPGELELFLRRLPTELAGRATESKLRSALWTLGAVRRFFPRRKSVRVGGASYGRPADLAYLEDLVAASGYVLGVAEALALGHTDVDELAVAGHAARRELRRFNPRLARRDADLTLWARRAAKRAAARARIKRVSGLSVPQRQMPLVGKLREQLARGVEGVEELARATGLDLDTVEALLPAAQASGALQPELVAAEGSVEEAYEAQLLRQTVEDALDGLVGLERLVVEAYMVYGDELAAVWPDLLKGKVGAEYGLTPPPEAEGALVELRKLYRHLRKELGANPHPEDLEALPVRAARRHAARYWNAAKGFLQEELAPFVEA
ncbi:hypothetical protein [Oceanithermus sp.]|uniref:hypothetical protein n=1 Tax=Oceanithermus sp. TaxID=2268145 RepID=UPI00257E9918|nr:hypothetical protein [Oceanithermus sp.]